MPKKLVILLLLFSGICFSQKEQKTKELKPIKVQKDPKVIKAEKIKKDSLKRAEKKLAKIEKKLKDTTYIIHYRSSIIFGLHYSVKPSEITISAKDSLKKQMAGSGLDFKSNPNSIIGIDFTYDKLSVSLEKSIVPSNIDATVKTDFHNLSFNFGGNEFIVEGSYKKYKGFYDGNSLDTTTKKYYNRPDYENSIYMVKVLYFLNHKKFAFKSNYASNIKQNKTCFTWVVTANANYNTLHCDSSFIAPSKRKLYGDFSHFREMNVISYSVYGGASLNLVLGRRKGFGFNLTVLGGPEDQFRTYKRDNLKDVNTNYLSYSYDVRASFGINRSNYYLFLTASFYRTFYNISNIDLGTDYRVINLNLGWRIHANYPKFYQKIQKTKLYQLI